MTLLEIQKQVDKAAYAYYTVGSPIMTDEAYDDLIEELNKLNPSDIRLKRVGFDVRGSMLEKTKLNIPMGSQSKVNTHEEYDKWLANNIYKNGISHNEKFLASHKMDGLSMEMTFAKGVLTQAVTRGDSVTGENITANARLFKGIPFKSNFSGFVRCEVVLKVEDWDKIDPDKTSNPRNLASLARRKNGEQSENLTIYAFKIYDTTGTPIGNTEEENLKKLKELGFNTIEYIMGTSDEVWDWYNKVASIRSGLPYWIDGIVSILNNISLQDQLGSTDNRPKSSIAIKFIAEKVKSTLLDVRVQVGSQGQITPIATITPCQIGGATVESPTLYNYDNIENLDLCIGDEIEVCKLNDIIPGILRVLKKSPTRKPVKVPTHCPVCNSKLEKHENISGEESVNIYCVNDNCEARISGRISKYVKSLDIQGLGESIIVDLIKNKLIETAADLYLLKDKEVELADLMLSEKTRLGEKRAKKIINNIENKRKLPLNEFLGSLGINSLGKRRVAIVQEALSGKMDSLTNWLDGVTLVKYANESSLPNAAIGINDELIKKKDYILKFIKNGVSIAPSKKSTLKDGAFTCVLTGKFKNPKDYYHKLIENSGNGWSDTYSKSTTYLVTNDVHSTSSKMEKAKKNGTKIITADELLKLIGQ